VIGGPLIRFEQRTEGLVLANVANALGAIMWYVSDGQPVGGQAHLRGTTSWNSASIASNNCVGWPPASRSAVNYRAMVVIASILTWLAV
jgi:hypothetical protein